MTQHTKVILANIGLFLVAAIWGGGFIAGKAALSEYDPFFILAIRFLGAALLTGILFFPAIRHSPFSHVKRSILLGVVQFTGLAVQLIGLRHTTAGKQAFLIASYVMFVPLIAWILLKKHPKKRDFLAAFLTLIGVGFMSLSETFSIHLGDGLSLLFALIFGLQIVLTGIFAHDIPPLRLSFFQFLSAGILATIMVLSTNKLPHSCSLPTFYSLLYLVVANTVIAFTIQNAAQKYASETTTSILLSLESVFGFLFSVWIFHEPISFRVIIGCILIFCAVLLSKIPTKERQKG